MNICFTKFGNVVEEFSKLENVWKDNSIELIWDVNELAKTHKVTAISEDYISNNAFYENNNIKLYVIKKLNNKFIDKLLGNIRFLSHTIKITNKNKIDYWITTDFKSFFFLIMYCKIFKINLILNFCNDDQDTIFNVILIKLFGIKDIIVPGPHLKNRLIQKGIKADIFPRIPRYPKAFFENIPVQSLDCKLHVLYAARLTRRKGIREFMNALTDIYTQIHDVGFTIIGDGEEMAFVQQQIHALPDSNRVRVLGNIPNTTIGTYMRQADVLVFPSYSEGFAKTWIEAILSELPMILTPVESITSTIKDNVHGIYVPFNNYKAIYNSIIDLYQNTEKLHNMKYEMKNLKNIFINPSNMNFCNCVQTIIKNNSNQ